MLANLGFSTKAGFKRFKQNLLEPFLYSACANEEAKVRSIAAPAQGHEFVLVIAYNLTFSKAPSFKLLESKSTSKTCIRQLLQVAYEQFESTKLVAQ